ncbi:MAG: caspase family protein, partial [Planctomycetes bacterium]|nr:caspase family protein [Planctomycetota bacterium]
LDDAFGRWIQELDGRKVVIILDTCHSGGQATHEKGVGVPAAGTAEFDFLDGELARAKDVGQKETALLTSSKASELSMERREGDLSVMTYFLTRQLRDGSGPLTLSQIHGQLKDSVPLYVEKNFPGATQTPVLADETTPPFYLRP